MPELPELEVMADVLQKMIVGRCIHEAVAIHPGILKTVTPPVSELVGGRLRAVTRRGKHLVFSLREDLHLVLHLMLAGRLVICGDHTALTKATAFRLRLDGGEDLRVIENATVHRAAAHVVRAPEQVDRLARTGPEPLSDAFTADYLADHARGRQRHLKTLLTDQEVVAGIGATYADEILFDARLSPIRYASTVKPEDVERLHASVQRVLRQAIDAVRRDAGGVTLTPTVRTFLRVVKRTGLPCLTCGTKIAEIRYAQKKTYYCPQCQRQERPARDRRAWLTK